MNKVFNVSCRKVGGIRFLKVGRFNVSWSVSRAYRPIGAKPPAKLDHMLSGPFYAELAALAAEVRANSIDADYFDGGEVRLDR
jgi:hypothetical protein